MINISDAILEKAFHIISISKCKSDYKKLIAFVKKYSILLDKTINHKVYAYTQDIVYNEDVDKLFIYSNNEYIEISNDREVKLLYNMMRERDARGN